MRESSSIAVANSEKLVRLYDPAAFQLKGELVGHADTITDLAHSATHPAILFSSSSDKTVCGWDLRSQQASFTLRRRFDRLFALVSYPVDQREDNAIVWI